MLILIYNKARKCLYMKEMKACIFNIQKYSIHDGPGIRTVVFFKGCPLRCKWCSNPESQYAAPQITWDRGKCIKCLHCVNSCPEKAILQIDSHIIINPSKCTACLECTKGCPQNALSIQGKYVNLSYIMEQVLKDKPFYEESNGGVTLSGGEVMQQHVFAEELLKLLKENNIHTAIETEGYAPKDIFTKFIDNVDLLLFDVKHFDRQKHFENTNVYNDMIIENLRIAIERGKEVIVRIPVIPGVNNSLEDAEGFCKLLKPIGATKVNLLPFHQFGQKKYELLNKFYELDKIKPLHEEDLLDFQKIFIDNDFNCYF